jgi:PGF-CTERM protein
MWWCNSEYFDVEADDWDRGFCGAFAEPVLGCMDSTANNYNADATEDSDPSSCTFDVVEEPDEVPGFGLLSAVAAIGVVLLLRRRL